MSPALEQKIESLKNQILVTKGEFETFISNKELPLEQRWNFFGKSPSFLKNHKQFLERFEALSDMGHSYYTEFGIDRYTVIVAYELVENVLENVEYCKDSSDKSDNEYLQYWTNERINLLKEEILLKNIGSFCNDW